MSSILSNLNPAQKEAVIWPADRPLLILAGAGSGKTRILTHRIAHLISQGIPAFTILGVTFTNKAAGEMKSRVQRLVSHDVWVSTFHSTCLKILRMDGAGIELDPRFTIYDEQDQLTLIKECLKELNFNDKQVHPKGVRERIQRSKDYLETSYQVMEKASDWYEENLAKVYQLYEEKLTRLKALDFGDLIMKTVGLFDRRPEILKSWQDRFQHVLIDEYQDTNHAQYRLVKLLAQARRQITVVGDPDQSIYAWRGADIKNILNFEKDYPESGTIKMEQNYRSTSVILDAANELIKRNQMRKPKALWTEREGGDRISLVQTTDEKEEALYVASQVAGYCREGKTLADQVVFYRVHAQSRVIEDHLRRANIPYKIVGGVRFYDRREIKDLIAYLRAIAYPHDEVSLKRILNVPARGIGKKALEVLEGIVRRKNISFDEAIQSVILRPEGPKNLKRDPSPPTAAQDDRVIARSPEGDEAISLSPKAKKAIHHFYSLLTSLRKDQKTLGVDEILEKILAKTGYIEALEAEKTIEAQSRIENIEEFYSAIEDFEEHYQPVILRPEGPKNLKRDPSPTSSVQDDGVAKQSQTQQSQLEAFLESISLVTDLDTWESGTNVLTLMTFHTAKGLEFPIVYMVGMEEGIFPNMNAYSDTLEDLEEERRLCYVGITRAKDKLHMIFTSYRRLYGSLQHNLPSRFLTEIPSALFHSASVIPEGFAGDQGVDSRQKRAGMTIEDDEEIVIDFEDE
ncbi:MAG: UvrD-helicase domain-containing protein [Candidatus Omnitrophica bacterium]|nr:UvrD-helicase domain-containing protein [Candidatus Omnitrophota bacterium]